MDLIILKQIGVAVVLAALIGIERERKSQLSLLNSFGGIRTFIFIGLISSLSYILFWDLIIVFSVLLIGFLSLIVASYVITSNKTNDVGATTELAAVLVYLIGILSAMEYYILSVSITLFVTLLLYLKEPLHVWISKVKGNEIISTLEFILIAFIVLPLLPNTAYGPYGFFNPYVIWLVIVLISGISFVSYIAIKGFGAKKGICFTGFLSGLISSTALVFSFSGQSKKNRTVIFPYVVAVVVASTAVFFRVLLEVFILNPDLLILLLVPMLTMGITGSFFVFYFLFFKSEKQSAKIERSLSDVRTPLAFVPALKFGILFAIILFLSNWAQSYFGSSGIYLTSVVSGLLDVDAITVSISTLANGRLADEVAVIAITLAVMANTAFKALIFLFFGAKKVAYRVVFALSVIVLFGLLSFLFI